MTTGAAPFGQGEYVANQTDSPYLKMLGVRYLADDVDGTASGQPQVNSGAKRELMLVQNGSVALFAGEALNFVAGQWMKQVQAAPITTAIRGYAPYSILGNQTNTIPALAFFLMVINGPCYAVTDGTAINENDIVAVGAASGKIKTDTAGYSANVGPRGGSCMVAVVAKGTHPVDLYCRINAKCDI